MTEKLTPASERPDSPRIGIRRWGDGCFHPVEEEVPEGFIVNGMLIRRDEVVSIVDLATGRIERVGK